MLVDLHVHTTASDGSDSPEEVVIMARKVGLKAIGVTDHDTIGGVAEAIRAGKRLGLEVIEGIELSTEYRGQEVHVLGYLMDLENGILLDHLTRSRKSRLDRIYKMIDKLKQLNLAISISDVLQEAAGDSLGRPHLARVLVRRGVVSSVGEAFEHYLGKGGLAFVPRKKSTPWQAVKIIRQAGGVAVLAHPGLAGIDDCIPSLVEAGLQGIEVYHPQHSKSDIERYKKIADRWALLVTGGSDYHGRGLKGIEALGNIIVSYEVVERLRKMAAK